MPYILTGAVSVSIVTGLFFYLVCTEPGPDGNEPTQIQDAQQIQVEGCSWFQARHWRIVLKGVCVLLLVGASITVVKVIQAQ